MFRVEIRFSVNYLCFLEAVAGINWNNRHTRDHAGFLNPADRAVMESCRRHLTFGDGDGGGLALPFFFFPSYLELDSRASFAEYLDVTGLAMESGNWIPFETRFAAELAHIRDFYPGYLELAGDADAAGRMKDLATDFRSLSGVILNNLDHYRNNVWIQDRPLLGRVAAKIPTLWGDEDLFGRWEAITGIRYPHPAYRILLVAAMANGPNANSLAADTNTFYADDSEDSYNYYRCFFSHEVGTHLIAPLLFNRSTDRDPIGYAAMENLARYYNLVLHPGWSYSLGEEFYHTAYFSALYAEIAAQHPQAGPAGLFDMARTRAGNDLK